MFVRLLLIVALLGAIYFFLRWFARTPPEKVGQLLRRSGFTLFLVVIVFLALTGRLNWIFALIAALLPWMQRALGLLRLVPLFQRLYQQFRGQASTGQSDRDPNRPPPSGAGGSMTEADAYEALGLKPGAGRDEIINAHRKLMQKLHPDRGGNDWLASRINQARDLLLAKTKV
ncbi:MAG: DnaJ domain-containing protein [Gammaproteobacteria bacterium]|nr:DnaJ domain-containing protein [Gammaproteobacteria bacterium]MCP5137202.1 DnaJ domain-containing protein [Gammaproteobacteria bacterium]